MFYKNPTVIIFSKENVYHICKELNEKYMQHFTSVKEEKRIIQEFINRELDLLLVTFFTGKNLPDNSQTLSKINFVQFALQIFAQEFDTYMPLHLYALYFAQYAFQLISNDQKIQTNQYNFLTRYLASTIFHIGTLSAIHAKLIDTNENYDVIIEIAKFLKDCGNHVEPRSIANAISGLANIVKNEILLLSNLDSSLAFDLANNMVHMKANAQDCANTIHGLGIISKEKNSIKYTEFCVALNLAKKLAVLNINTIKSIHLSMAMNGLVNINSANFTENKDDNTELPPNTDKSLISDERTKINNDLCAIVLELAIKLESASDADNIGLANMIWGIGKIRHQTRSTLDNTELTNTINKLLVKFLRQPNITAIDVSNVIIGLFCLRDANLYVPHSNDIYEIVKKIPPTININTLGALSLITSYVAKLAGLNKELYNNQNLTCLINLTQQIRDHVAIQKKRVIDQEYQVKDFSCLLTGLSSLIKDRVIQPNLAQDNIIFFSKIVLHNENTNAQDLSNTILGLGRLNKGLSTAIPLDKQLYPLAIQLIERFLNLKVGEYNQQNISMVFCALGMFAQQFTQNNVWMIIELTRKITSMMNESPMISNSVIGLTKLAKANIFYGDNLNIISQTISSLLSYTKNAKYSSNKSIAGIILCLGNLAELNLLSDPKIIESIIAIATTTNKNMNSIDYINILLGISKLCQCKILNDIQYGKLVIKFATDIQSSGNNKDRIYCNVFWSLAVVSIIFQNLIIEPELVKYYFENSSRILNTANNTESNGFTNNSDILFAMQFVFACYAFGYNDDCKKVEEKIRGANKNLLSMSTDSHNAIFRELNKTITGLRQEAFICGYFVDILDEASNLVIEIDGAVHKSTVNFDAFRDGFLKKMGYRVMRFPNNTSPAIIEKEIRQYRDSRRPMFWNQKCDDGCGSCGSEFIP